jgi:hypothetical protein
VDAFHDLLLKERPSKIPFLKVRHRGGYLPTNKSGYPTISPSDELLHRIDWTNTCEKRERTWFPPKTILLFSISAQSGRSI